MSTAGAARQGSAWLGLAWRCKAGTAGRGPARHGKAWQAWLGAAWRGGARIGTARQGGAGNYQRTEEAHRGNGEPPIDQEFMS